MASNRFYLACFRDNVGSNIAFHGLNGCGYFTDLRKAEVYTREEAQKAWERAREYDQPISADHIDELACYKVDCQYIPSESDFSDPKDEYVAYKKGEWNGNDVYWYSLEGATLNFNNALKLSFKEAKKISKNNFIVIPFSLASEKKRPTFSMSLLNRRVMIQGAGLKMPHKIKLERRRKSNPKTRWNCPSCGKIHWQENPYEFESCNDYTCELY